MKICRFQVSLILALSAAAPSRSVSAAEACFQVVPIERVWAGHPVGFCLFTKPPWQWVAYYDADRQMSVAQRRLQTTNWVIIKLPSRLGWDSHNYVTMALDRQGYIHLAGNMHCVPLVYFRSRRPYDAGSLERVPAMVGERERRVTYPVFIHDRQGRLIFRYRDGGSGNGDDLYNVYDETTRTWKRLVDQPLVSGQGRMNAYCTVPTLGPDGRFHMVWVWRDTPDCASNHDLSYARSPDLVHWTDSRDRPIRLPITLETGEIIDPVPPGGGLLNVNRALGFDNAGRPVVTYHKYDRQGDLQVYAARPAQDGWQIVQVSDWKGYRWDFGGPGAIVVEVKVGAVKPLGNGRLALKYRYPRGSGVWVLDEATLRPISGARPPKTEPLLPPALAKVESDFPGMLKHVRTDSGEPPPGERFVITWETLPANRDRPRPRPWPAPSWLRLVRLPDRAGGD